MKKNEGPCSIQNCSRNSTMFRKITSIAYKKAQTKGTLKQYDYLKIGQEICYSHYLDIVEPDRHLKKKPLVEQANINNMLVTDCDTQMLEANIDNDCNTQKALLNNGLTFADQIQILTKVLYKYQREKPGFIELSPVRFQLMIENADSRLCGFFDQMVRALIPNERSTYKKLEAKKTVVSFCYMMANARNMFVNSFELEVGLYLSASGTSSAAIDTLHNLGVSVCSKTINNYKKKLVQDHFQNIQNFFTNNGVIFFFFISNCFFYFKFFFFII